MLPDNTATEPFPLKEERSVSDKILGWPATSFGQLVLVFFHGLVATVAMFFAFSVLAERSLETQFESIGLSPIFAPLLVAWLSVTSALAIIGSRGDETSRKAAADLEAKADKEETLVDYVIAQLVAATARQEVAVSTAARRANRLASVGFFLMLSSVLVPFGLVYLYMTLAPTAPTTTTAPQRDWHLLLVGVSLGLLFIAAARGILLAEGRQRDVYAREVRETAYYGDLRRALGMAQRLDREDQDVAHSATREVVRKIMGLMLERGDREQTTPAAADLPAGEHEFLKIVTEAIKK